MKLSKESQNIIGGAILGALVISGLTALFYMNGQEDRLTHTLQKSMKEVNDEDMTTSGQYYSRYYEIVDCFDDPYVVWNVNTNMTSEWYKTCSPEDMASIENHIRAEYDQYLADLESNWLAYGKVNVLVMIYSSDNELQGDLSLGEMKWCDGVGSMVSQGAIDLAYKSAKDYMNMNGNLGSEKISEYLLQSGNDPRAVDAALKKLGF